MRQLRFTAFVTMGFLVVGLFVSWLGMTLAFTAGIVLQSVLLLGATVFAVGYFGRFAVRLWLDIRDGMVMSAEGFVRQTDRKTTLLGRSGWTFYWSIDGGPRFPIRKAWGVLVPGRHRLFYLPRTRQVVAAEPVGGADSLNS